MSTTDDITTYNLYKYRIRVSYFTQWNIDIYITYCVSWYSTTLSLLFFPCYVAIAVAVAYVLGILLVVIHIRYIMGDDDIIDV